MIKGSKLSEEWKKNIGLGNLGRVVSEETKRKISNSLKGNIPWNIGVTHSEETKKKLSELHKGKHHSEETIKKFIEANSGEKHWNFGKHFSEETRKKMSLSAKARINRQRKPPSKETREKLRQARLGKFGDKSPSWKGGITPEYLKLRMCKKAIQWRITVFERDKYTCQKCGDNKGGNLNAHHIKSFTGYPELRFNVSNGITLCKPCHKVKGLHKRIEKVKVLTA